MSFRLLGTRAALTAPVALLLLGSSCSYPSIITVDGASSSPFSTPVSCKTAADCTKSGSLSLCLCPTSFTSLACASLVNNQWVLNNGTCVGVEVILPQTRCKITTAGSLQGTCKNSNQLCVNVKANDVCVKALKSNSPGTTKIPTTQVPTEATTTTKVPSSGQGQTSETPPPPVAPDQTSTTNANSTNKKSPSSSFSVGAIIGIVFGAITLIAGAVALAWVLRRKKTNNRTAEGNGAYYEGSGDSDGRKPAAGRGDSHKILHAQEYNSAAYVAPAHEMAHHYVVATSAEAIPISDSVVNNHNYNQQHPQVIVQQQPWEGAISHNYTQDVIDQQPQRYMSRGVLSSTTGTTAPVTATATSTAAAAEDMSERKRRIAGLSNNMPTAISTTDTRGGGGGIGYHDNDDGIAL